MSWLEKIMMPVIVPVTSNWPLIAVNKKGVWRGQGVRVHNHRDRLAERMPETAGIGTHAQSSASDL